MDVPIYADSLASLAALNDRRLWLTERQEMVSAQIIHRCAVAYRAGEIAAEAMQALYRELRDNNPPGWSKAWAAAGLPCIREVNAFIRRAALDAPNESDGSWSGGNPIVRAPRPSAGTAVVYLLYDEAGDPVYLGSTASFVARLSAHRHAGKSFAFWRAWPCADREDAYRREEQMLRQALPRLNVKAGR